MTSLNRAGRSIYLLFFVGIIAISFFFDICTLV